MSNKGLAQRVFTAIGIARELNGHVLTASKPDGNGYYRSPVIQFNANWRGGDSGSYDTNSLLDALENPLKSFNIALKSGNCYGEYYHPIYEGQPLNAWVKRCMTIDGSKESHFVSAIEPGDLIAGEQVLNMVHKPSGPYGADLEKSLKDPDKNTSYSIRCLVSKNKSRTGKYLIDIIKTFDHCDCPGFEVAGTRYQPHLHKVSTNSMGGITGQDLDVSMTLADVLRGHASEEVKLHSAVINDIKIILHDENLRMDDCVKFIDKINRKVVFKNGVEKSPIECFFNSNSPSVKSDGGK